MTLVPGLETIRGLVGEPPIEIPINKKTMGTQQKLMEAWNTAFIAVIPYCYRCKVPLAWHQPPYEKGHEDELFTCPSCGRVWVRGEGWNDKTKKDTKTTG